MRKEWHRQGGEWLNGSLTRTTDASVQRHRLTKLERWAATRGLFAAAARCAALVPARPKLTRRGILAQLAVAATQARERHELAEYRLPMDHALLSRDFRCVGDSMCILALRLHVLRMCL